MKAISRKSALRGRAIVPGSKSHTIRAVLLAAMSEGTSVIQNPLPSQDGKSALEAAAVFGSKVTVDGETWIIGGKGKKLQLPENYLECGNSGSVSAFAAPMAGLIDGYTFVTGDAQIRRRPIRPIVDAINALGGTAFHTHKGSIACPFVVGGVMKGGQVHFDGKLSQMVSGIMMTAPLLEKDTEIFVETPREKPYLDITLEWVKRHGVTIENSNDYKYFRIKGNQAYKPCDTTIASDWSGVAFPVVAGIVTDSEIIVDALDFNDSQGDKAVIDYLIAMGADIIKDFENNRLIVKGGRSYTSGITVDLSDTPDSLPALSVAAAYATGKTVFTGLAAVRLKETDRVAVMESELKKMGANVETGEDYMIVSGGRQLKGAEVESHHDHRIAMAMMVCGLFAKGDTIVNDAESCIVSFPTFFDMMKGLGADITQE